MAKLVTALTLAALLSGCASTRNWVDAHPRATLFIGSSIALSAGLALHTGRRDEPRVPTPSVDCSTGACK